MHCQLYPVHLTCTVPKTLVEGTLIRRERAVNVGILDEGGNLPGVCDPKIETVYLILNTAYSP